MDNFAVPTPRGPYREISDAARRECRDRILAEMPANGEIWVFGFGSLMWNPCFSHTACQPATLSGYQRKFHIWTAKARGTPDLPGLGLCLEPVAEGECRGMAYRLDPASLSRDLEALWQREMTTGIYSPIWHPLQLATGTEIEAITFVVNSDNRQYAGAMPVAQMAVAIARAHGEYGSCRDYLAQTIDGMASLEVYDHELDELLRQVDEILA